MMRALWAMGCLVLLLAAPVRAEEVVASWSLTPDSPRVGDRLLAQLGVTHPAGVVPDWDAIKPDFANLELDGEPVISNDGGAAVYTLYADLPGAFGLPRVALPYTLPDGTSGTVRVAAYAFSVEGVFDPARTPPAPLPDRPSVSLPISWGPYLALGALLTLLALWGWRRWRGRQMEAKAPVVAAPPPVPAHIAALAALDRLDPERMPPEQFFSALSEVTRSYLDGRFGIPALSLTTREILAAAPERAWDPAVLSPLDTWLPEWDLIKFARMQPADGSARQALSAVRGWVERTVPEPEPSGPDPSDDGEVMA
ncbi:MAG: hypothetical protein ACE5FN_09890 [Leptospirillia bacterium]